MNIQDPAQERKDYRGEHSAWSFTHFVLGTIAIFVYVGVEVGIPGTLNFYLSDPVNGAGMDPSTAVAIAGFVAGTYWFLMLVGRLTSSVISGKVSARTQLTCVSAVAIVLGPGHLHPGQLSPLTCPCSARPTVSLCSAYR